MVIKIINRRTRKICTGTFRPPPRNPSKTLLIIESPTMLCSLAIVLFCRCIFFSRIILKVVFRLMIFFLFLIFTSFKCFSIELVFPRFKLLISCWESFWFLLVLLICGAMISFLSDSFVSFELSSKWHFGIVSELGCTALFCIVSSNLLIVLLYGLRLRLS